MEIIPNHDHPEVSFLEFSRNVDKYIVEKYLQGKVPDDARGDAIIYLGALLMSHQIEDFFSLLEADPEKTQWDEDESKMILDSIRKAKLGDWQGIKECLQNDIFLYKKANTAFSDPRVNETYDEKEATNTKRFATALTNLANSIQ